MKLYPQIQQWLDRGLINLARAEQLQASESALREEMAQRAAQLADLSPDLFGRHRGPTSGLFGPLADQVQDVTVSEAGLAWADLRKWLGADPSRFADVMLHSAGLGGAVTVILVAPGVVEASGSGDSLSSALQRALEKSGAL